ncbi:MAG: ROK family protein [Flavobacteriia bacterium]|nr:ROK family protein [Flavobacteriia bacterium]
MKIALGIDIGGTKTAYGFVDEKGNVLLEKSVFTTSLSTPLDLVQLIKSEAVNFGYFDELVGVGIGAPNGNQFTGSIDFAPNLHWKGQIPLVQLFKNEFTCIVLLTNDANAAAIGEKLFGVAKDFTDFVEITLGTGLGSGIFVQNELLLGKHGIAGEYGHIRMIPNGRVCGCGRKGCLETYASSTGVVRSISELQSDNKKISKLIWLENPTAKDVFDLALNNDLFAIEIVDFTAKILGSALADYTAFSDPEAFVLFGGLSKNGDFFTKKVEEEMNKNMLNIYQNKVKVLTSSLNDLNAAILGTSATIFWEFFKEKKIIQ